MIIADKVGSEIFRFKELFIHSNKFTNLEFIKPLTKLANLNIEDNNITSGLEYLPVSLKKFGCKGIILHELASYGMNLIAWQQAHPELMGDNLSLAKLSLTEQDLAPVSITAIPEYLLEEIKATKPVTNQEELPTNFTYTNFALLDKVPLVWTNETKELPLRLYNLTTKQVISTEGNNIPHYAILSYVWGKAGELSKEAKQEITELWTKVGYNNELNPSGYKSLHKAIEVGKKLGINYLWMDQLCIDQHSVAEKNQEVPKMRQYYSNSFATLIAIDNSIGEKNEMNDLDWAMHIIKQIVTSPWFTRSWTFQEGWLSKQTIFMFDDGLVDGRILAKIWAGIQDGFDLNRTTIFSTPLGWSVGAKPNHSVNLKLTQALDAVKNRQQTVALDSLYSLLGLLSYGKDIEATYKENICKDCKENEEEWYKENKESIICEHPEELRTEWPTYFKEELEQPLQELMELAIAEHPYEIISWWGERRSEPKLWQLPAINANGTTNIEEFMNLTITNSEDCKIIDQGILIIGQVDRTTNDEYITILPNKIISDRIFAILVPQADYKHLLPIKIARSNYTANANDKIFIDMVKKQVFEREWATKQYEAYLEVPTKH